MTMPDPQAPSESNGQRYFLARSEMAAWRTRRLRYLIGTMTLVLLVALSVLLALWIWPSKAEHRTAQAKYVWIQMLPDEPQRHGARLVRAIVTEGDYCPTVVEDGKRLEMDRRLSPLSSAFPILVCEAKLAGTSDAWVGTHRLPPRPDNPQDIVVIGDTGCRMVHWQMQPCNSGVEWPFAAVATSAATTIRSAGSPSIIVHVGDFHYRENPCTDRSPSCGGSPFGDNWTTWEEEFFRPARPLLLAAPWAILRGNHENCARAGAGWLFFFALPGQQKTDKACEDDLDSYSLYIGKTADGRPRLLALLDTAYESDEYGIEIRCGKYRDWIGRLDHANTEMWLALHQPLLYRAPDGKQTNTAAERDYCKQKETKSALNVIRARLLSPDATIRVRLLLSGDLHVFQYFQPASRDKPVQVVAGHGGTKLDDLKVLLPPRSPDDAKPQDARGAPQRDAEVTSHGVEGSALTIAQHGFVTLHRDGSAWTVKLLDATGQTQTSCRFSESLDSTKSDPGPDCSEHPKVARQGPHDEHTASTSR